MTRSCDICGAEFEAAGTGNAAAKRCSDECTVEAKRRWQWLKNHPGDTKAPPRKLNRIPRSKGISRECNRYADCDECAYRLAASGACAMYLATCFRPMTLEEIGDEEGLTRERIRQIEDEALAKLRKRAPHLLEYMEQLHEPHAKPWRMQWWRASELNPALMDEPERTNPRYGRKAS